MARGAESNLRSFFAAYARLGLPEILRVLGKVANQLVEAHSRGDHFTALGPSTLFMFSRGTLTLASPTEGLPVPKGENLGERAVNLEKWLRSSITDLLTAGDIVIEFSQYLAPEFFSSGTTDERSDIYSFGVLAYRLATGRYPFASRTLPELVAEKLDIQVRPPGDANFPSNPEFDAFITRCLTLVPTARYSSARAMLESLLAIPAKASVNAAASAKFAAAPKLEEQSILGKVKERLASVGEGKEGQATGEQDDSFLGRLKERIVNPVLGEREKDDNPLMGAEYIASPKKPAAPPPDEEQAGYHPSDEHGHRRMGHRKGSYDREDADELRQRKPEKIHDELTDELKKKLKIKQAEKETTLPFLGAGIPQLSPVVMVVVLIALTAAAGSGVAWLLSKMKSPPPPSALQLHLAQLALTPGADAGTAESAGSAGKSESTSSKAAAAPAKGGAGIKLSGMPAVGMRMDKEPPAVPEIMRPKSGETLADGTAAFYGIAEEFSTVEIYDNGTLIGRVQADSAWVWTFRPEQALADGEHRLSATAIDEAGNISKPSAEIVVQVGRAPVHIPVPAESASALASDAPVSAAAETSSSGTAGSALSSEAVSAGQASSAPEMTN